MLDLPWKPAYYTQGMDEGVNEDSPWIQYTLAGTIIFTLVVFIFEGYLDARQKQSYQKTTFPTELEATVRKIDQERAIKKQQQQQQQEEKEKDKDAKTTTTKEESKTQQEKENKDTDKKDTDNDGDNKEKVDHDKPLLGQLQAKFTKSQAYGLDKINFGMIASTYDTLESIAFLKLGFLPYLWDVSAITIGQDLMGWTDQDEIKISLVFLLLTTIIGTITSLPFELYSTFQIERKHGFNKQTIGLFVSDKIKSFLLTCVIGAPFVALLLKIIMMGGDYFYIYVWGFMFAFSSFMMTIVPVFIMPIFNKYEPLPDGELKTKIYELAAQLKYPLKKLFVMDGSKRSSHSNAFMFGFGNNKRIVLFDTLMEQVDQSEILAILGHELGHWKLGHTLTNFGVTQVYFGAAFYFFSLCFKANDLYAAFGFTAQPVPIIISLLLFFQTLWAPVDKLLSFILTVFSRHCEFGADKFSVDLNMSLKLQSGLCKIHLENLGAMCPDPLYSMYHYSHPPLVERLSAMMELDKKKS